MKKRRTTIIMVLFFFIGLLVLLYPSISNFLNEKTQSKAINNYELTLDNLSKKDYSELLNTANEYNKELQKLSYPLLNYKKLSNYNSILNINNNGMMGYLSINKIKVELPIYHGTSADVLNIAVGHLEGSSLPVGGKGTHSVLSAHRGLPSSKLFTDLDKIEIGDTFTITIFDKVLTYQVDKISIVKPNEVNDIKIDENEDYVTLATCTPYGINTHRLLVRGKRIATLDKKKVYITTEAFKVSNLIVTPLAAVPIILTILLIIIFKPIEKNLFEINKYIYPSSNKGGLSNEKN